MSPSFGKLLPFFGSNERGENLTIKFNNELISRIAQENLAIKLVVRNGEFFLKVNDKLLSIFAVKEHSPAYIFTSIGENNYYCTSGSSQVRLSINNTEYKKLDIQVDGLKTLHESNDNYVRQKALKKVEEFHHGEKPRLRRPQTITLSTPKKAKVKSQSHIFSMRRAVLHNYIEEKTDFRQIPQELTRKVMDEIESSLQDKLVELYFVSKNSFSKSGAQLLEARVLKHLDDLHYPMDHWLRVKVMKLIPQLAPKKTFPEKPLVEKAADTGSPVKEPINSTPLPSIAQKGLKKTRLESTRQMLKQKNIRATSESPMVPSPPSVEPRSLSSQSFKTEKSTGKSISPEGNRQSQPVASPSKLTTAERNGKTVKARKVENPPHKNNTSTFLTLYDQYKAIHVDLCTDRVTSKMEKRVQLQKLVDLHNQLGKLKSQLWKHSYEDEKAS